MRNKPAGIGGVAGKTAADHIVHAAARHGMQGMQGGVEGPVSPGEMAAQEEFDQHGLRELGCGSPATVLPVIGAEEVPGSRLEVRQGKSCGRGELSGLGEQLIGQAGALRQDFRAAVFPGSHERLEQLEETRQTVTRLGREVGAAVKRMQLGGQEDGHGPAALTGESDDGGHVEAVQVGAFLPVDFDADEMLVQEGGGGGILEGFVGHDVAPVAGGIADAEEDGLILPAGLFEGLGGPGVPVDRVSGVLAQVGGEGRGEVVGHEIRPLYAD